MLGLAAVGAGVVMALDAAREVIVFDIGWCAPIAALVAGLGLLTVAPALARDVCGRAGPSGAGRGPQAVVPSSGGGVARPCGRSGTGGVRRAVAGPGPFEETPPSRPGPNGAAAPGRAPLALAFVLAAAELGLTLGGDWVAEWSLFGASPELSVYWWAAGLSTPHAAADRRAPAIVAALWLD